MVILKIFIVQHLKSNYFPLDFGPDQACRGPIGDLALSKLYTVKGGLFLKFFRLLDRIINFVF